VRPMKPLAIELFAGLFGWGEGLIAEGYKTIGFDIIDMFAELRMERRPEFNLVLQDVTTLHGSRFKDAAIIVASPPCQAYSYRAMPWKRAKALPPPDNTLFEACFRIQREASEAAGHRIPMIVENVRGAQKWVGRAKWRYGSYYLWGDVPALMPMTQQIKGAWNNTTHGKCRRIERIKSNERVKIAGQNWSRYKKTGEVSPHWNMQGIKNTGGSWFPVSHNGDVVKQVNDPRDSQGKSRSARKRASAEIAKIPFPLANWIARCFY